MGSGEISAPSVAPTLDGLLSYGATGCLEVVSAGARQDRSYAPMLGPHHSNCQETGLIELLLSR